MSDKPVKKEHGLKGKPSNGKNSPVIGNNGLRTEPGDNTKYLQQSLEVMNLPDIDMHDVKAVSERINEYFMIVAKYDLKPTVAGLGLALNGMSRQTIWAIRNDAPVSSKGNLSALPKDVTDLIKKTYKIMENLWENYMQNGKINPVSGIFLGKNNFGYVDKQEHVLTPNQRNDSDYNADDIRSRYLIDSQTTIDSADSNDSENG